MNNNPGKTVSDFTFEDITIKYEKEKTTNMSPFDY